MNDKIDNNVFEQYRSAQILLVFGGKCFQDENAFGSQDLEIDGFPDSGAASGEYRADNDQKAGQNAEGGEEPDDAGQFFDRLREFPDGLGQVDDAGVRKGGHDPVPQGRDLGR